MICDKKIEIKDNPTKENLGEIFW